MMEQGWITLSDEISRLAAALPASLVVTLAETIRTSERLEWPYLRARALAAVSHAMAQFRVNALFDAWQRSAPHVQGAAVALALLSAAQSEERRRQGQRVELVWTGPESQVIPFRRTDQALLQLINGATRRLLIVSFAVYDIDDIAQALLQAAQRRVAVVICLETPDASAGRIAYNTIRSLGDALRQQARIYIWPLSRRPTSPDGRHGSLHAKVAVADGNALLVSSANLTSNAMTLNMELGTLVRAGELPASVEAHFNRLIALGCWSPYVSVTCE